MAQFLWNFFPTSLGLVTAFSSWELMEGGLLDFLEITQVLWKLIPLALGWGAQKERNWGNFVENGYYH